MMLGEGSIGPSALADEPLSKTPCRIALLGLPVKLGKIEAKASIFPTSRDARLCAAIFDRRDTPQAPPLWNAVNRMEQQDLIQIAGQTLRTRNSHRTWIVATKSIALGEELV